jgi:outer membrane lipopolysaccharide assembly protein LptE/RlpB
MTFSRRALFASFANALLLTGCGYQLRGLSLSADGKLQSRLTYQHIYLLAQESEQPIVSGLSRSIRELGMVLVDDPTKAEIEVILGESKWQTVTSAIGNYGEISARLVILTQSIQVRHIGSSHWLVDTQIRRSREIDQASSLITGLGAERPLAISRESEEVTNDVRQRVIDALVRIIQRLEPLADEATPTETQSTAETTSNKPKP